jgi:peptidoglycan/LPS O-acetylase OafA/YrhL
MKKAVLIFVVVSMVLATTALCMFSSLGTFKPYDLVQFGIIGMVIVFAIFVGFKRLRSARRGEPVEDEMSKKVMLRAAAFSYYISLYLWVAILFIKDRVNLDTEELIGAGILGMAVSLGACWLYFNFRGVKSE